MSSLYKRATPIQKKMLKIIEGAVKNAYHAHPGFEPIKDMDRFARGVAKRAVGTLTAQYDLSVLRTENIEPDVLAGNDTPVTDG